MKKILLLSAIFMVSLLSQAQNTAFEGEVMYENTVTSSKGMKKLYPSLLKDGTYAMQYTIKGEKRKMTDTYAGLIQYENRERDLAYIYSPLLKKGYKYKISDYEKGQAKKYEEAGGKPAKKTGEKKEIEGLICYQYKGATDLSYDLLGAKMVINCTTEYWVCPDFPKEYIGAILVEGLPVSFDEMQIAQIPLLGSQKQHQNLQMTEIKKREVDISEVTPPSGIDYQITEDPVSALMKIEKEISKYMKKNKLTSTGVDVHHGKIETEILDDAWD